MFVMIFHGLVQVCVVVKCDYVLDQYMFVNFDLGSLNTTISASLAL